jgi:hypothetical protein
MSYLEIKVFVHISKPEAEKGRRWKYKKMRLHTFIRGVEEYTDVGAIEEIVKEYREEFIEDNKHSLQADAVEVEANLRIR